MGSVNTQDCEATDAMDMKEAQTPSCNSITFALLFRCNERRD